MEDVVYHFDSENINLVDSKVNDGDSTPFANGHEENDTKTLICENEFQDHTHLNEVTTTHGLKTRTNEIEKELKVIVTSSTALNKNLSHGNKESQSLSKVESKSHAAPFKGGVQLVRLQAVSELDQSTKVERNEETQNSEANSSAVPQRHNFGNKIQEISDNHLVTYSEPEYQFLTPIVPSVPQKVFDSPISEGSFDFDNSNFMTLGQPENISDANTPNVNCASNVVNRLPSHSLSAIEAPMSITNSSSSNNNPNDDTAQLSTSSSFQYMHGLPDGLSFDNQSCTSTSVNETPDRQQMQRFYTVDNQVVYGYKDSHSNEFHFFYPALSNRESHNEKERKRRSRVSEACCTLRNIVPGLSDKTDKATVFEQAAAYLNFLRETFSSQFDQSYCEKYFQERK